MQALETQGIKKQALLKRSYDVAKNNIILCIRWNAMCLRVSKTHYYPHTVHYRCSSMLSMLWLASYPALWLAEYLKHVMEMLRPAPYCDAFPGETKTIKPIINLAFVASSGDIITDYDDLYTVGVDRLSAWPIIGADIKHFTDYRYRAFSKQMCR